MSEKSHRLCVGFTVATWKGKKVTNCQSREEKRGQRSHSVCEQGLHHRQNGQRDDRQLSRFNDATMAPSPLGGNKLRKYKKMENER